MAVVTITRRTRLHVVRRDVDDVASAPIRHHGSNRPAEEERALGVAAEDPVELRIRIVEPAQGTGRCDFAGVVHEDVDSSVHGDRCIDDSPNVCCIGDIAHVARRPDLRGGVDHRRATIRHHHPAALVSESAGEGPTETLRGTGDDRHLTL